MIFQNNLNNTYANNNVPPVTSPGHVLLIENDRASSLIACTLLETYGFKIDHITDGRTALEKIKTDQYDLVMMDSRTFGMNSIEATMLIREYEQQNGRKPTKIICATAYVRSEEREKCFAAGMNGYISKPYNLEIFRAMISDTMGLPKSA